ESGLDELLARHFAHRAQYRFGTDAAPGYLGVDHLLTGVSRIRHCAAPVAPKQARKSFVSCPEQILAVSLPDPVQDDLRLSWRWSNTHSPRECPRQADFGCVPAPEVPLSACA